MREPGIVHSGSLRSISSHVAPMISPVRAAVRMVNSKARAVISSRFAELRHKCRKLVKRHGRQVLHCLQIFARDGNISARCPDHRAGLSPWRKPPTVAHAKRARSVADAVGRLRLLVPHRLKHAPDVR